MLPDDDEDNDQPNTLTSRDDGSNISTAQTVQTARVDTMTLIRHLLRLLRLQQTRRWFVTLLITKTRQTPSTRSKGYGVCTGTEIPYRTHTYPYPQDPFTKNRGVTRTRAVP